MNVLELIGELGRWPAAARVIIKGEDVIYNVAEVKPTGEDRNAVELIITEKEKQ